MSSIYNPDYRNDAELYELVENIPGERSMCLKAVDIISGYAREHFRKTKREITLLDLCCGTAPILRMLPGYLSCPLESVTGVDISKEYLRYAEQRLWERVTGMGSDWFGVALTLFQGDVLEYNHPSKVDVILASSAYHHIEDARKHKLLKKIDEQLEDTGIVVFCENLIPDYNSLAERMSGVTNFYAQRIKQLARKGIVDKRLGLLCRVLQYELDREYEWKHSYRMFREALDNSGFGVVEEYKVWPQERLFDDEKAGDFVFVAKKKITECEKRE